jgi:hypothetical protein
MIVDFELEDQHWMDQRMVRDFAQREVAHIHEGGHQQAMAPAILCRCTLNSRAIR